MPEFIYQLSSAPLYLFLSFVIFFFSLISLTLVRRYIPLDFRYRENTAIVSCSALLGIIYAVLIGFIILYQLGAFEKAGSAENLEGSTLHAIYHNASLLPQPQNSNLQTMVTDYTKNTLDNEWPALNVGNKIGPQGRLLIEKMIKEVQSIKDSSGNLNNTINNIQQEMSVLFKLHHERTATVHTVLNGHIWLVLLLGTFFTLGINYFLGMEFRLHVFRIFLIALIMTNLLYLIVGLDRPYQGDFAVQPDTIQALLDEKNIS
jgi:hypothetical protein